jgi:hypothetical protein
MDTTPPPLAEALAMARATYKKQMLGFLRDIPLWTMLFVYIGICFLAIMWFVGLFGITPVPSQDNEGGWVVALGFAEFVGAAALSINSIRFYEFLVDRPYVPLYVPRLVKGLVRLIGTAVLIALIPVFLQVLRALSVTIWQNMVLALRDTLSHYVHTWLALGFAVGAIVAALVLYFVRSRARLFYGLSEFVFGLMAMLWNVRAILSAGILMPEGVLTPQEKAQMVFQFIASIYITIRGLNNIEDGLRRHVEMLEANGGVPVDAENWLACEFYRWWDWVFSRPRRISKATVPPSS